MVFEGTGTRVLVEQLGAVDIERLGELSTALTSAEMWAVDDALALVLAVR